MWAAKARDEVSSRTAFHWHKQVSLPDTCICLVLEEAGVGVCWGRAAGSGSGAEERDEAVLRSQRDKENWDLSLLFSNLQKSIYQA